ncbi:hypothetical protein WMY93_018440 [Mugilogobius chulae]|uniref:Macro domain-containing protein n=1 Tax=Mugilogobius chulae TaxID=88201 RepID=A0AAW0NJ75_9GOBI
MLRTRWLCGDKREAWMKTSRQSMYTGHDAPHTGEDRGSLDAARSGRSAQLLPSHNALLSGEVRDQASGTLRGAPGCTLALFLPGSQHSFPGISSAAVASVPRRAASLISQQRFPRVHRENTAKNKNLPQDARAQTRRRHAHGPADSCLVLILVLTLIPVLVPVSALLQDVGSRGKKKLTKMSRSARAGVLFPVGRMMRYLRTSTHKYRIGIGAPVYMAAVIEYLAAEILELAGNAARDNKKGRITPRHIKLAVANDEELNQLLRGVTISNGGVLPRIHPELLSKKRGTRARSDVQPSDKQPETGSRGRKSPKSASKTPKARKTKGRRGRKPKNPDSEKESEPNSTQDDELGEGFTILSAKTLFLGQKLSLTESELGKLGAVKVEAVVNPTNADLDLKDSVGNALEKAGGRDFVDGVKEARKSHCPLEVGAACVSAASAAMAARFVIHCHVPVWGSDKCEEQLEKTVKNCLSAAEEKKLKTIAFPALTASRNGFPKQTAAQLVLKSISSHLISSNSSSLKNIYFILFDAESIGVYLQEMAKLDGK